MDESQSSSADTANWIDVLRMLFFTRYSIAAGAILLAFAVLPILLPYSTIQNPYVVLQPGAYFPTRIFALSWLCILAASIVITSFRTTLYNAAFRFDDPKMEIIARKNQQFKIADFSLFLIGCPIPLVTIIFTLIEAFQVSAQFDPFLLCVTHTASALLGIGAGLVTLWLFAVACHVLFSEGPLDPNLFPRFLQYLGMSSAVEETVEQRRHHARQATWLEAIIVRGLESCGLVQGYLASASDASGDDEKPRHYLATGHGYLATMMIVLVAIYSLTLYLSYSSIQTGKGIPDDDTAFGIQFYLIGIVMMLTCILPGMAFLLDRYRIPLSWVIGAFYILVLLIDSGTKPLGLPLVVGHHFEAMPDMSEMPPIAQATFDSEQLEVKDLVRGWYKRQTSLVVNQEDANRTFVIVTASGGGIQASGWTTRVLEGLGEDFGPDKLDGKDLLSAIGAISCVSGGSVGTLHYLSRYPEIKTNTKDGNKELRSALLRETFNASTRSSLEAVGFGLMFPDSARGLGVVRDPTYDRGWIQEKVWAKRMNSQYFTDDRSDWRLGHLAHRIRSGELPGVFFNSFSVDSGQRILISPILLREGAFKENNQPEAEQEAQLRNYEDFVEFGAATSDLRMRLATAARLSAAFPYVSPTPIAHEFAARRGTTLSQRVIYNSHLGDGGYTDNEGLLTAISLIWRLDQYHQKEGDECEFDRILLIRIAPFPVNDQIAENSVGSQDPTSSATQAVIGPLMGLYNGRVASQVERGSLEVNEVENFFDQRAMTMAQLENEGRGIGIARDPLFQKVQVEPIEEQEVSVPKPLTFDWITVDFKVPVKEGVSVKEAKEAQSDPPLSWMLGRDELEHLDMAWRGWKTRSSPAYKSTDDKNYDLLRSYFLKRGKGESQ